MRRPDAEVAFSFSPGTGFLSVTHSAILPLHNPDGTRSRIPYTRRPAKSADQVGRECGASSCATADPRCFSRRQELRDLRGQFKFVVLRSDRPQAWSVSAVNEFRDTAGTNLVSFGKRVDEGRMISSISFEGHAGEGSEWPSDVSLG